MAISLARGRRTTLAKVDAFADGVAVKTVRNSSSAHLCDTMQHEGVCTTAPRRVCGSARCCRSTTAEWF